MTSERDKIIFKNSIVMILLFTFTSEYLHIDFSFIIIPIVHIIRVMRSKAS